MISHSEITIHSTIPEYSGEDPNGIFTLENIKNAIEERMNSYQIPVSISFNEIKSGGIFKSTTEDCILIANPDHMNDYFQYCITVRRMGIMATISTYRYGRSALSADADMYNEGVNIAQEGGFLSRQLGKVLFKKPNEQKIKEEHDYYTILNNCIMSILGG